MRVEVVWGSIGELDADVLMNASNTLLKLGSGVSHAIRIACGPDFQGHLDEVRTAHGGAIEPGEVVMTHAGAHVRATHVVHSAVMEFRSDAPAAWAPDEDRLRRAYEGTWSAIDALVAELGAPVSVGIVALGAGTGGFGLRPSVAMACETLRASIDAGSASIERAVFVGYDLLECANMLGEVEKEFAVDAEPAKAREMLSAVAD